MSEVVSYQARGTVAVITMDRPPVNSLGAPLRVGIADSVPKAVAFPEDVKELRVIKEGKGLLLLPANAVWDDFFDRPGIDIEEPADPIDDTVISFD